MTDKKNELLRIAEELLTREVLTGEQVKQIISGQPLEVPPPTSDPVVPEQPTNSETDRSSVVAPLGKPVPQE